MAVSKEVASVPKKKPVPPKEHQFKKRIDWDAVRASYVEGFPVLNDKGNEEERKWATLQEVADRFGIRAESVRRKSGPERWVEQRAAYQARVADTRRRRRAQTLAKEAVEFDGRALSAAKLGMTMVQARLGEIARDTQTQAARRADAERRLAAGLVIDPTDFESVIDARELNVLGQAASQFQSLARTALGEDIQRVEHSGVDGGAIEIDAEVTQSIRQSLSQDDPERLAQLLDAMERAKLFDGDIQDAELVEDDDDEAEDG